MAEKHSLPPYTDSATSLPQYRHHGQVRRNHRGIRGIRGIRRSKGLEYIVVAILTLILVSQWKQVWRDNVKGPSLDMTRLNEDLALCQKLHHKPKDPAGVGRHTNDRYLDGGKATLIKNATIWIGEPVKGTSEADARAGKGWRWISGDVLLEKGLISKVQDDISETSLPKGSSIYNAKGRLLTAGIIDMHSHMGVNSLPALTGSSDVNEMGDNITPWARSIDGFLPLDPQIERIKSGGITTSLVLPGSGNNIGGEAFLFKHAVGKPNGRNEIGARDMLADPAQNWRYMKMACGENAKKSHGRLGKVPYSRLGESYEFRHAFEQASNLIRRQDDWCAKAEAAGIEHVDEYLPQEIAWETLTAALRGHVHVNIHCYTVPDLEAMVDHTNEFKFPVRAFHHAHQTFLVPEILKRTWGGRAPSSAIFATNGLYKTESYVDSEFAGKYLYDEGLTPIYVSDNPVLNAQRLVFEAAKGFHNGLPYHAALAAVTTAPAEDLGMGQRLGKIKPGFDADVVVWDSDPLSIGALPVQVWIDGVEQFAEPVELSKTEAGPMVVDRSLQDIIEKPTDLDNVVFTGVTNISLTQETPGTNLEGNVNVVVSNGDITCVGMCKTEMETASKSNIKVINLRNGYIARPFIGVAGKLGLNEIDAETTTDNGENRKTFTRGIDGLMLEGRKLQIAHDHGVTRAISAPKFSNAKTNFGTSVGFFTGAQTTLSDGAVFAPDLAVHYTLDQSVRGDDSYSSAFGELRHKLVKSVTSSEPIVDAFSEELYLKQVINGERVLALNIHSADGIATALHIKSEVGDLLRTSSKSSSGIRLAIVGGAEAHLVASELAAASVGVILAPAFNMGSSWDARRILPGAPLTNGTGLDHLLNAGVKVAIGLEEDWQIRDLTFLAGTAFANGEGRLSEKDALDLISGNALEILGASEQEMKSLENEGGFVVFEGSPLTISGRLRAVGSRGKVSLWV